MLFIFQLRAVQYLILKCEEVTICTLNVTAGPIRPLNLKEL